MRGIGFTKNRRRCKNDAEYLFCHKHKFQMFNWTLSFLVMVGLFGGLYKDVWKPAFSDDELSIQKISSPASIKKAKSLIKSFYGYDYIIVNNSISLDFDFDYDGRNESLLIDYSIPDKGNFVEVFYDNDNTSLLIKKDIQSLYRNYGMAPIIHDNKPYLAFWEFAGTLSFGSVDLYEFNSDNLFEKTWESEPFFKAAGNVEDGELVISAGSDKFALYSEFDTINFKQINLDINEDPLTQEHNSTSLLNLYIKRSDSVESPLLFYLNGKRVSVEKITGSKMDTMYHGTTLL